jgi:hypothetical protein
VSLGTPNSKPRRAIFSSKWRSISLATACLLIAITSLAPASSSRRRAAPDSGLVVHEWGTFTTIAGADGTPVEWLPIDLSGGSDLPGFVEHFRNANTFKACLRGTVRMETPVIYFHTPHEIRASVHVSFAKGLITEWYPHASSVAPSAPLSPDALYNTQEDGSISWDSFTVSPEVSTKFPRENTFSHYYAARNTSATPLSINGPSSNQPEKFLFYRGVSNISLPLSAEVLPSGDITLDNRTGQRIPSLILFERRGDKLGYRIVTSPPDRAILQTPSVSGTIDSLRADLEDLLAAQGLFRDESRAMVETWQDSWFEEGSRIFYIVPRDFVDSILPLSIQPAPDQVVRTFVGRIELLTPGTEKSIDAAIASNDSATLKKYGRFLFPIFELMVAKQPDSARQQQMWDALSMVYR